MVGSITLGSKVNRDTLRPIPMPELPEVEVVRVGLEASLLGATVSEVRVRQRRLRWPVPEGLESLLGGQTLRRVSRRGKYLLLEFDHGTLIVHLGMSGSLTLRHSAEPATQHDHLDIGFGERCLRYRDPRRFGAVLWHAGEPAGVPGHPLLSSLGVEPLSPDFDGALLYRGTRGRRVAVKQLLLSGRLVVGVGNIYASESLFRAGIRPATPSFRIGSGRCDRLAQAIRETLRDAIERGGSSLRDFVGSNGEGGYFQLDCFVYGRGGLPCRVCGRGIRMRHEQGRATYWCVSCQH
jgi:formamidopyrimidine-DNA glycosylase